MNFYQDLKRNLESVFKSGSVALMLGAVVGCTDSSREVHGVFRDLSISAASQYGSRRLILEDENSKAKLWANDFRRADGRFDKIELINVPKGHRLESYTSLDSLELAYGSIMYPLKAKKIRTTFDDEIPDVGR
ncbi:MAG TPA: hypothetical protein VJH20_04035 [Candidatus Nanoarchaeia archaeon]|nr:hypothetical protein [Candidatus Nanoarchaeia archaeon]